MSNEMMFAILLVILLVTNLWAMGYSCVFMFRDYENKRYYIIIWTIYITTIITFLSIIYYR